MAVIEAKQVFKKYKDINALDNFNVKINENKIVGLIGKNGAGKTTFLKACAGRIQYTSGELEVFGESVFDNLDVVSNIIFVDEESQYDTNYRIIDILTLAKAFYSNWDNDLALKLLKHFNLSAVKKYKKLSRGMKTQVNIIVGICSRTALTILDEPTLGLDAAVRKDFYNILLTDYMNHPRTIIISSHLINEIETILEDLVLIDKGKVVMSTTMEEFKSYGILLSGETKVLEKFTKEKDVINKTVFQNSSEFIIKNDLTEEEMSELKRLNITSSMVSPQDLFINITSRGEMFNEF